VCSFIRLRLRRRALVVFLTALDDPALAESFVRSIELVSHQHLILVNVVQPPGAVPLFSDPNVSDIDDLYERLGGHLRWHNLQELGKVLHRKGPLTFRRHARAFGLSVAITLAGSLFWRSCGSI
jgi:hypothetical protein